MAAARSAGLLPPELWDHVLAHVDPEHQQHTALALSRALPRAHPSPATLVRHLRITRRGQATQTSAALRHSLQGSARAVESVTVELWRDDHQLLVNLLLLPTLHPRSISLTVGPLAAPEHIEDLLDPAALRRTQRWRPLEQLAFRFNPYTSDRSYYTFLKGAYFDTAPLSLARYDPSDLPALRRLSFIQDLPPTYGTVKQETPAFGLHDLAAALDDAEPAAPIFVPVSGKFGRVLKHDKMDFAQPIVFFQLGCLTRLAVSPIAAQLTHLTFRLPRRALLPALTDLPPGSRAPFPALRHLDLSTTHVLDDARVPMLLRLYPTLETLVLDRCSGLVSREAVEEPTAVATLRWLAKGRPTDSPTPPVRDLVLLPSPPALRSLALGLHTPLAPRARETWGSAFKEGYADARRRAEEKASEGAERWARWGRSGRLEEGTARVALPRDALASLPAELASVLSSTGGEPEPDPVPLFARFCTQRALVPLPPSTPPSLVHSIARALCAAYATAEEAFVLCLTADCSDRPGRAHLVLSSSSSDSEEAGAGASPRSAEADAERERRAWSAEREEEHGEGGWRRGEGEHERGCAHLEGRRAWAL